MPTIKKSTNQVKCLICGKKFTRSKSNRLYCCSECAEIGKRKAIEKSNKKLIEKRSNSYTLKVCPICNKEFKPSRENRLYCCSECAEIAYKENRKKLNVYNHDYYMNHTKLKRALKRAENITTKICPVCNKEFTTTNNCKKYCSNECREIARKNLSREYMKFYAKTEKYRASRRKYEKTEKYKALKKRYFKNKKEREKALLLNNLNNLES